MAIWSICLLSLLINSGSTYINPSVSYFHQPPNSWWTFQKKTWNGGRFERNEHRENMMISTPRIFCIEFLFHIHGSTEFSWEDTYILRPPHTLQQIAIGYMDPMGFGTCNFLAKSMTRSLSWKILKGNKTQRIFSLWQPTAQFPWGETRVVKPQQKMLWKIIRDSFKNTVSRRCLTVPCPKSGLEPGVLTIWVLLKKFLLSGRFNGVFLSQLPGSLGLYIKSVHHPCKFEHRNPLGKRSPY